MLRFVHHRDPDAFRAHVEALLYAHEAECSLLLGNAMSAKIERPEVMLATVDDDGGPVVAAIRTPPHRLMITDGSDDALRVLAEGMIAIDPQLPGVFGPSHAARAFAETISPGRAHALRKMRLHALTRVAEVPRPSGTIRPAHADDVELLIEWGGGFVRDTEIDDPPPSRDDVQRQIDEGRVFVWDDAGPRTMAAWGRPTRTTITINMVYTPPAQRGRGYATACVAALSEQLLEGGRSCCVLFTDVRNPTSNAIYARIGYRPLVDCDEWVWDPP